MKAHIVPLVLLIGMSMSISRTEALNCTFEDTVNLTLSQKFSNGSYLYEGVLVPPELTDYYDYVELYAGEREPTQRHVRGCVCHLKQCVKFCCHPKAQMYISNGDHICDERLSEELFYSPYLNITLGNGSRALMHVLDEFVLQTGLPCVNGYMLTPHKIEEDKWELLENGTLLLSSFEMYLSRRDYCLQSYQINENYVLHPMMCPIPGDEPPAIVPKAIVMLIAAPFLYATILIYWLIPELRNLHTKCLIGYLLSLAIGTTSIGVINLLNSDIPHVPSCTIIGIGTYYFLLAAFFWLNVICFDLWLNFRGKEIMRKRFFYYTLYAWGVPALMTVLTIILQHSNLPMKFKSGIGARYCYLKTNDWSAMIYFYGPCLLLIICNIVIFYLTAKRIFTIRKELRKFSKGADSQRHARSHQNDFWLFFRMFIVTGISWLLEVVGYMIGNRHMEYVYLQYIADFYNASQGIIIFVLFVMKRKVLLLLKKRILGIEVTDSTYSTESICSEEAVTLQNIANGIPAILK